MDFRHDFALTSLLTDLSKAFDSLLQDSFYIFGLNIGSPSFNHNYAKISEDRRTNSSFEGILFAVPQDFILGILIFNTLSVISI